ncbi:MAG: CPBP family intramembrane glutamic endopeptidase [Chlorobiaceae bacterium]
MQNFFPVDPFAAKRLSFVANTIFLFCIMALYPLAGSFLFTLFVGGSSAGFALLPSDISGPMLSSIRSIQAFGQILVLALPVVLLAGWHTRSRNPFSAGSLAFLGIGGRSSPAAVLFAILGVFLLQPLLHSISELQNLYLWPALGAAGAEVIRQQELMDSFIGQLASVGSLPEFIAVALVFALVPALTEEVLFRGYIQQNYSRSLSPKRAVLLTGAVFAFFHLSAANLLPLALLGWYIGYIYSKTGDLTVPIAVHFANNFTALLLLEATKGAGQLKAASTQTVIHAFWWWIIVAGTLFLFVVVVRRFLSELFRGNMSHRCAGQGDYPVVKK